MRPHNFSFMVLPIAHNLGCKLNFVAIRFYSIETAGRIWLTGRYRLKFCNKMLVNGPNPDANYVIIYLPAV